MSAQPQVKTVVVTGGSSGIGLGVARAFFASGANVVLGGRDEAKLHAAAREFGNLERIAVVVGDVAESAVRKQLVATAIERFGRIDVLFNNAGHFEPKSFLDYSEEDLDGFLSVHVKGMYFTAQEAVKEMRKQGGGAIISNTTVLAMRGVKDIPSSSPAAAKGAINAFTRSLAIELADDNIRVNAVAPGIIKTPLYEKTDEEFHELDGMQPLGHVGEVEDIAEAVVYLADAEFVTGVVLPVDGGVHAGGQ